MHAMNKRNVPKKSRIPISNTDLPHSIREHERARIARDLHDELGGNLCAIKLALSTLIERLPFDPYLTDQADYLNGLVDYSIVSLKRLYNDLRPAVLDFGLIAALEWQVAEFYKRQKTRCVLTIVSHQSRRAASHLHDDQATALFRIVQEALTNIARHSFATNAHIQLNFEDDTLTLSVQDDGSGLPENHHDGFGLHGMRERADEIGAVFEIKSSRNGVLVCVSLPLSCEVIHQGVVS